MFHRVNLTNLCSTEHAVVTMTSGKPTATFRNKHHPTDKYHHHDLRDLGPAALTGLNITVGSIFSGRPGFPFPVGWYFMTAYGCRDL